MDKWTLRALTKIWTGDVGQKSDRLIPPGIMGSLRWWYEVLVRGLGGKACDPTSDVRCPDQNGRHCVACELFGCTGWARKFRLMVLDDRDQVVQNQIQANQTFILRFIPLRPIELQEWCLLDATLRLIADYGAIGGKTVFKPSDEPGRENALHHRDFGLLAVERRPKGIGCSREVAEEYARRPQWRRDFNDIAFAWASLQNFWCVNGRYLARQNADTSSFNFVIGRAEPKSQFSQGDSWLAGRRPDKQHGVEPESKKVFSFKDSEGCRTFGFVKPGLVEFDEMKRRLGQVWSNFQPERRFLTGEQVLNQLF